MGRWRYVKGAITSLLVIHPVARVTLIPQGVAPLDLTSRCDIVKSKPTNMYIRGPL